MKILLVADKFETHDTLSRHFGPRGFDFIHYQNPIKAMDNLDEIAPHVVIFSAEDFPRHWKPFIRFLHDTAQREQPCFILLVGNSFSSEEASKADYLAVNGTVPEQMENPDSLNLIEQFLTRSGYDMRDMSGAQQYAPTQDDGVEFVLSHPDKYAVATGTVVELSPRGATFLPDDPTLTSDIPIGAIVPYCSLKLGSDYLSLRCKVLRNKERISLHFENVDEETRTKIVGFIETRSEPKLQTAGRGI